MQENRPTTLDSGDQITRQAQNAITRGKRVRGWCPEDRPNPRGWEHAQVVVRSLRSGPRRGRSENDSTTDKNNNFILKIPNGRITTRGDNATYTVRNFEETVGRFVSDTDHRPRTKRDIIYGRRSVFQSKQTTKQVTNFTEPSHTHIGAAAYSTVHWLEDYIFSGCLSFSFYEPEHSSTSTRLSNPVTQPAEISLSYFF